MKYLIFLSLIFTQHFCFAQTTTQLDLKNGFKDFKIGDSKSKWAHQIEFKEFMSNRSVAVYEYTSTCCKAMFNQPLNTIELGFSTQTERLVYILLSTGKLSSSHGSSNEFSSLCFLDFKQSFGPPDTMDDPISRDANFPAIIYTWSGSNMILKLTELFSRDYKMSVAEIFDKKYLQQKNAAGF